LLAVVSVLTLRPLAAGCAGSQEKVVELLAGQQYAL
jgi:hypothetical protein